MSNTCHAKGCTTPMLGRERERADIEGLLDQVLTGRSRSLVVTGETGLGNTPAASR